MTEEGKSKMTAEELLAAIEEADAEEEAERILALSDEEVDRELAASGIDPAAARRRGREIGEEAMRRVEARKGADAAAATPVTEPKRDAPAKPGRRAVARWAVLLVAAAGAAAVAAMLVGRDNGVGSPAPDRDSGASSAPQLPLDATFDAGG